jgi:hypothetical protein
MHDQTPILSLILITLHSTNSLKFNINLHQKIKRKKIKLLNKHEFNVKKPLQKTKPMTTSNFFF